jgi:predicted ATPase/signal transduction histidine kinase/tRNA A-37 threonylcarbamoyl transferase component Bud32
MQSIKRYQIKEKIHQKNDFIFYRALKETDNRPYILKILDKRRSRNRNSLTSLKQEYVFLNQIDSECVINAVDWINDKDLAILVLDDINGQTIKETLRESALSVQQFLDLSILITKGLISIHEQNIVHKDINPGNIIWNAQTNSLKIIDFNIASKFDFKIVHLGNPENLQGTLAYISPEQTGRMNHSVDQRSDLYSLGITFYEMLTNSLPFQQGDPMSIVYDHLARDAAPPHLINDQVPKIISEIVMRLLAKNPEERYQSAVGLMHDLKMVPESDFGEFNLGENDFSGKLQIPEKLYGRKKEVEQLLGAYRRVRKGSKEMILAAGFPGTGKTALVNEIHKPISKDRGYFIRGKFDLLQRTIPYYAFIQALNQFCQLLLTENRKTLSIWKKKILNAVGESGKVLTDVIPRLEAVIGKQPDVPVVGVDESRRRFNYVFQRFFEAVSAKEHPLVIFIDDLQWSDPASLSLLKLLLEDQRNHYLLFIGAYRDNEVSPTHPLMIFLGEIQKQDLTVQTIPVNNLLLGDVNTWLSDTLKLKLNTESKDAIKLTQLIYEKTQGNAFFTTQFLKNLYKENLLFFDHNSAQWKWDIAKIKKQNITDNVVELLSGKIKTLPLETQDTLTIAACVGNSFKLSTLSVISGKKIEELENNLETAVLEQLVSPVQGGGYQFIHDRIHQAAYSLISEESKKPLHLKIGLLLLRNFKALKESGSEGEIEKKIFEIVNHLNTGIDLIHDENEKLELVRLNVIAGENAKISAAYKPASDYIQTALKLLPVNCRQKHYDLTLTVYNESIQTSYLCGDFEKTDGFAKSVLTFAKSIDDKSTAFEYRLLSLIAQNQPVQAIDTILKIFNTLGVEIPRDPAPDQNLEILTRINDILEKKGIDSIKDLSEMRDAERLLAVRLFCMGAVAFIWAGQELLPIVVGTMVGLILKYGMAKETPYVLAFYALVRLLMGDVSGAYQLGETSLELTEKEVGNKAIRGRSAAFVSIYTSGQRHHFKHVSKKMMDIYPVLLNVGDFEYAAYMLTNSIMCINRTDTELSLVREKAQANLDGVIQLKQSILTPPLTLEIAYNDALLGKNKNPAAIEIDLQKLFKGHQEGTRKLFTWQIDIKNVILSYLFEDYDNILQHVKDCEEKQINLNVPMTYVISDTLFYFPLAYLKLHERSKKSNRQKEFMKKAKQYIETMKSWAEFGPVNFLHKYYLLLAELSRVTDDFKKAAEYYEKASEKAYENEYVNEAALINELAAKFYMNNNQPKSAAMHFSEARNCYQKWGAIAKVKHLEENYPKYLGLRFSEPITDESTQTNGDLLDVKSIIKASHALSGEVKIKNLLEKMMQILIENAGAQKSLFIKKEKDALLIQAIGSTDGVTCVLQDLPVEEEKDIPLSVIHYVARSEQRLVFDNIANDSDYAQDAYIQEKHPKSVVCFPVLNKGELFAVIYLENNSVEGAFTQERLEIISILSAQIAISIENTALVENLEEKVEQRTAELEKAHQQIIVLEKEATEQQMAGGFAHEMRNALVSSKLVIEQALGYDRPEPQVSLAMENSRLLKEIFFFLKERLPENELGHVLNIMKKNFANEEHVDEIMGVIYKSLTRGLSITQQIMEYSRIGHEKIQGKPIHMDQLIQDQVGQYRPEFNTWGIEFVLNLTAENTCIMGQETHFTSIFDNLILNARDALLDESLAGGNQRKIAISSNHDGRYYQVNILDNGVGISEENQASIFEAFFSTKPETGTGLGLGVVKKMVSLYHGEIDWSSKAGQGTNFLIKLPIEIKKDES